MNKQKIIQFVQSVVAIPMLAVATPLVGVTPLPSPTIVLNQNTATEASAITTPEEKDRKERAAKIDALLASYDSPLEGYGMKFVEEADENNIDWRLLVAIAGQESTFGRHACKKATNSFLGYGSCKINFKSVDEAIERVSASLGGNNENTDQHYAGKTTAQILRKYNSVIPNYPKQVMKIMKMVDDSKEIG
jgi:hypothetical protein